jgi:uncharacterized protein
MPEQQPINQVRRKDRAVTDEVWIREFLRTAPYGVVATESEGQPFLNPVTFVYDEATHAVYFHTGRKGRIFQNIAHNPRLCFNVSRMGRLLTSDRAAGFGVEYESVIVFGRAHAMDDPTESERALRLLLEKYFSELEYGVNYRAVTAEEVSHTAVFRLAIEAWSGKREP